MLSQVAAEILGECPQSSCGMLLALHRSSLVPMSELHFEKTESTAIDRKIYRINTEDCQSHRRFSHLIVLRQRTKRFLVGERTVISSLVKTATISDAHARPMRNNATKMEKSSINGLLLPHLSCEESDHTPITGCTIKPDSGGAIQTREVWLLAKPSLRRCGSKSAQMPLVGNASQLQKGANTSHFHRPCKSASRR